MNDAAKTFPCEDHKKKTQKNKYEFFSSSVSGGRGERKKEREREREEEREGEKKRDTGRVICDLRRRGVVGEHEGGQTLGALEVP